MSANSKPRPASRPDDPRAVAGLANDPLARREVAEMAHGWADDLGSALRAQDWRALQAQLRALLLFAEAMIALDEKVGRKGGVE